jgi:hypothetical protein
MNLSAPPASARFIDLLGKKKVKQSDATGLLPVLIASLKPNAQRANIAGLVVGNMKPYLTRLNPA